MASPYATGRRFQNVYKGTVLDGPFFRTDAGKAVKKQVNKIITDVLKDGVREVRGQLYKGHGKASGDYRRSITRRKRGLSGRIFSRKGGAISAWLQGESRLNTRSKFKGFRLWTDARNRLDHESASTARAQIAELTRDLGGS